MQWCLSALAATVLSIAATVSAGCGLNPPLASDLIFEISQEIVLCPG
jgi:hypothetical protein